MFQERAEALEAPGCGSRRCRGRVENAEAWGRSSAHGRIDTALFIGWEPKISAQIWPAPTYRCFAQGVLG